MSSNTTIQQNSTVNSDGNMFTNFFSRHKKTLTIITVILVLIIVLFAIFKINIKDIPNSIVKLFKGETKGVFESNEKEVFNVKTNMFTYDEAKLVCKSYGAELASLEQMVDAHKNGANWCNYGWSEEQLALYPIQESYIEQLKKEGREGQCGLAGLNGGYFANPNIKFGANCYGIKPDPSDTERLKYDLNTKLSSNIEEKKLQKIRDQLNSIQISPFNNEKWSLN